MRKMLLSLTIVLSTVVFSSASDFGLQGLSAADIPALGLPAVQVPAVPLRAEAQDRYFNPYVLKAVDYLYKNYGLKGYDIHSVLTHDIQYGGFGTIKATHPPLTMCVAAQMEVILTAMQLYSQETGDYSEYNYLPRSSFEGLTIDDIKGHIWVNHEFHSDGTADALINFGMGERRPFEQLEPGDFININRTNKTGHAVTFLGYIDKAGDVLPQYGPDVVGFKYFSSQGLADPGYGGFDFRDAVFSQFGCPDGMPLKRDCGVIFSNDQLYLNTGAMLAPTYWTGARPKPAGVPGRETQFDAAYFNGLTTDDRPPR